MKLFGAYGLEAPLASIAKCAADVKVMGYDGVSVIGRLANRWVLPPDATTFNLPWPYINGMWDMSQPNPKYYQEFLNFVRVLAQNNLTLLYKFQSVYWKSSWNKFPLMVQKSHPFRNNNYGIVLDKAEQVMDSITFAPLKYWWLKWDIISEPQNKYDFSPVNQFGMALMKHYRHQMRIIDQVMDEYPNWTFMYAPNNEEECGGPGDRSEVHSWFHDEWKRLGRDESTPRFIHVVNRQGDDSATKQVQADCGKQWGHVYGLQAIHELHIDGVNDRNHYVNDLGFDRNRTLFSLDGAPEDSNFVTESRKLAQMNDPFFDAKYWEGINGIQPAKPFRWMLNWNRAAKEHEKIIQ